jgi:hypothetical protein
MEVGVVEALVQDAYEAQIPKVLRVVERELFDYQVRYSQQKANIAKLLACWKTIRAKAGKPPATEVFELMRAQHRYIWVRVSPTPCLEDGSRRTPLDGVGSEEVQVPQDDKWYITNISITETGIEYFTIQYLPLNYELECPIYFVEQYDPPGRPTETGKLLLSHQIVIIPNPIKPTTFGEPTGRRVCLLPSWMDRYPF